MIYHLKDQAVLRFKGDAPSFLKGYTSNTLDKAKSAFLDLHGRIVATGYQVQASDHEVLFVTGKKFVERLQKHLEKYLGFSKTVLELTDLQVYFDFSGDWMPDGFSWALPEKTGRVVISAEKYDSSASEMDFRRYRVEQNLPWQGVDYDEEVLLNVADEEYVSYSKGCYLGQEIIARIHFKGKPSKKLVVRSLPQGTGSLTSEIEGNAPGEKKGFMFEKNTEKENP